MSTVWVAVAGASALSDRTFAATAAFTGAARFALMSDIAPRSGSSSAPCASSSSGDSSSSWVLGVWSAMVWAPLDRGLRRSAAELALVDGGVLRRVGDGGRAVRQDVRRDRGVHGDGDVGVDERHRLAIWQLLGGLHLKLLGRQVCVV